MWPFDQLRINLKFQLGNIKWWKYEFLTFILCLLFFQLNSILDFWTKEVFPTYNFWKVNFIVPEVEKRFSTFWRDAQLVDDLPPNMAEIRLLRELKARLEAPVSLEQDKIKQGVKSRGNMKGSRAFAREWSHRAWERPAPRVTRRERSHKQRDRADPFALGISLLAWDQSLPRTSKFFK